ncbi:Vesicle trafficking between the ER and Golgi [Coemansia helicoidea]|uniref:Vesicle trafficking between the ER and Golgi n=1 Tax=Coemansia helicoidea TaxID=1286919 RepID=A0ACC1KES1_9FUNG|nr:Vesicle trafficking between the ER and Golgi [Coemansia helicoidea]
MGGRAPSGGGGGLRAAVGGGGGGAGGSAAARAVEGFVHFDPKQARRGNLAGPNPQPGGAGPAQEAIVFMVGGGNYVEYQNLMEFAQQATPPRRIVYGATDIVNPARFLAQLARLDATALG